MFNQCSVKTALAGSLIVLAGLAAYFNSFRGAFVFDDLDSICSNTTIRHLWPIGPVFSPPSHGETVSGRPILNLSFAINYALSGTNSWGYHVTNVVIHLLNALLLLGILRRTFLLPALQPRLGRAALLLSSVIALLWVVHPLTTEAVTYLVQRAESLAALFYLLVLYMVIRGVSSGDRRRTILWYLAAVAACWLGVGAKETVATVPVMMLFYDRTLLAGTFRQAWRQRWGLYVGLATSWALLIGLMIQRGFVTTSLKPDMPDTWSYVCSQPGVILFYLRLAFWPHPLCLDWCWPVAKTWSTIGLPTLAVGLLLVATIWGLRYSGHGGRRAWGLLGVWFFLILAPSSSLVPLTQLASEHRMYLPLAAVLTLLVISVYLIGQRWMTRGGLAAGLCLAIMAASVLGFLTFQRNEKYGSIVSIWEDAAAKVPLNPTAQNNWGCALWNAGQQSEAIEHYKESLRLKPDCADAHNNLGLALLEANQPTEAIQHFEQAMLKDSSDAMENSSDAAIVHSNWGNALAKLGRLEESIEHYRHALQIKPYLPEIHNKWGGILLMLKRPQEAIEHFRQAVQIDPSYVDAQYNWGNTLLALGRPLEAIEHFQQVLQRKPDHAMAHYNWGVALLGLGRSQEAIEHFHQVVQIDPNYAQAQFEKAITMAKEALQQAEAAGQSSLAEKIRIQLQFYRDQKPSRE